MFLRFVGIAACFPTWLAEVGIRRISSQTRSRALARLVRDSSCEVVVNMRLKPRTVIAVTGAFVTALTLCGCQADQKAGRSSPAGAVRLAWSVTPSPAPETGAPPGSRGFLPSTPAPADFPMVPYWAAVRRGDEVVIASVDLQELGDRWSSREAALVRCMKREGFDFWPRVFHDPGADNDEQLTLDRDYLHIPYLASHRSEVQAAGYGVEASQNASSPEVDPNEAYVESLDAETRSAYYVALDGFDISDPDHDPFTSRDESGGCAATIAREYPEPQAVGDRDMYSRHGDLLSDMASLTRGDDIFSDARVIALNCAWRACMTGKGYVPDDPASEASPWAGPYQAVARARLTDPSGTLGTISEDMSALPDEQSRLVGSGPERDIALLDFECRQETDYLAVFAAAQRRLEQDFVTENRKELDSLLAFVDGLS